MQLFWLRNITMSFIVLTVLLALFVLKISLPTMPIVLILFALAITNLITRKSIDNIGENLDWTVFSHLSIDIISFSLIFYFTGGATNPFIFLYLIPLAISATIIPGRQTWMLTSLTVMLYSLLLRFNVPLTYIGHDHHSMTANDGMFNQHVIGMWFGFLLSATLVTWFITHLSRELKRRDNDITEARQRELQDEQLVTLGTLAAGTAYELDKPLASLSMIADEITRDHEMERDPKLFWNQEILRQQINRCKEILSELPETMDDSGPGSGEPTPAHEFIDRIVSRWRKQRKSPPCKAIFPKSDLSGKLIYDKTIAQALVNLLNRSADLTHRQLNIKISASEKELTLDILDDSTNINDVQIENAKGECFYKKPQSIGLFLALTSLRRVGGNVQFSKMHTHGGCTRVILPFA